MDQLSDVLVAISHPSRRTIINNLAALGPSRFTDIAQPFDVALNAITKHVNLLERAGLIKRERKGREVFISLQAEPLKLVSRWVHPYEQFWSQHLDRFETHFIKKNERRKK